MNDYSSKNDQFKVNKAKDKEDRATVEQVD